MYAGLFDTLHHIKELTKADKSFPCKQKNLSVSCFCSFFLKEKNLSSTFNKQKKFKKLQNGKVRCLNDGVGEEPCLPLVAGEQQAELGELPGSGIMLKNVLRAPAVLRFSWI